MTDTFKEKVRSMTAKEIIMAMVNGLKKEHVKVDMSTYGDFSEVSGICYGCAATNAVCEISGVVFTGEHVLSENHYWFLKTDGTFLELFETAIDSLRLGQINRYNDRAEGRFAAIKRPEWWPFDLEDCALRTWDYKERLYFYEKLADYQEDQTVTLN